jgi:8-oxo-dGTP diphosphatase
MIKLATLIYVKKNNQTLMMHRNKKENDMHEGMYNGLGGKFDEGESPEECAKRELFEESGLVVKSIKLKGFLTFPNCFGGGNDWYVFVYIVDKFDGELIKNSREGELEWIDDDKLLDLPLNEGDYIFMKWFEKPEIFSSKFNYDGKKLIDYEVEFY